MVFGWYVLVLGLIIFFVVLFLFGWLILVFIFINCLFLFLFFLENEFVLKCGLLGFNFVVRLESEFFFVINKCIYMYIVY